MNTKCLKVTLKITNKQIAIVKTIIDENGKKHDTTSDSVPTVFMGELARSVAKNDFSKITKIAQKEAKRLKCDFSIENTLDLSRIVYKK